MPLAQTIDDVIAQLNTIISEAERGGGRIGYFASLYLKVTEKVKEGIGKGMFQDGARMERLDVVFANRFLTAVDQWKSGGKPTGSWDIAFLSTKELRPLILQHLMLGINAHINLDLGIAAVQVMQGQPLMGIRPDFEMINEVIGSLTYEVFHDIDRMSPLLSFLGFHANRTNTFLVQFSVGNARDGAWCFAEELSQKTGAAFDACVASRDKDVAQLGKTLVNNKGLLKLTLGIIWLFEWKKVRRIIRVMNATVKTKLHASEVGGVKG